jgi:hypothetical protein
MPGLDLHLPLPNYRLIVPLRSDDQHAGFKQARQANIGGKTHRSVFFFFFFFLPPSKFYTWLLSLLNTWVQGLVQPLVPIDGPGYAWHLSSILLPCAFRLVYHTV